MPAGPIRFVGMNRTLSKWSWCVLALGAAGCAPEQAPSVARSAGDTVAVSQSGDSSLTNAVSQQGLAGSGFARASVAGDVVHSTITVRVGSTTNASIRLHRVVRERAPGVPRETKSAIFLMHGDFASFNSNFLPAANSSDAEVAGLALDLAQKGFDVWGLDRRWATIAPEQTDLADLADMGVAQELDDVQTGLAIARVVRAVNGIRDTRLNLAGFSRGGDLAWLYAAKEATQPAWSRSAKGLVILDVFGVINPADTEQVQYVCSSAAIERQLYTDGLIDSDNSFMVTTGQLALTDPNGDSPSVPGMTNRDVMLLVTGTTYVFFEPTPKYHLAASDIVDGASTHLTVSSEGDVSRWLAHATVHQSMRESVETDELWCGQVTTVPGIDGAPLSFDFSKITVPLYLVAAGGGYGDYINYTATRTGSTDVTLASWQLPNATRDEDIGHGDLLFAPGAKAAVWSPLEKWLGQH